MSTQVLYISYDGMTDPLGQSQVIPYLEGLSKLGYRITLVSAEKPEKFSLNREKIANKLALAEITWEPVEYGHSLPIISPILNLFHLFKKVGDVCSKNRFQIVHCRGAYITSFIGMWIKRKYGSKYLFDMRGFWPDERVDGGVWKMSNPIHRVIYHYLKRKEKEFLIESDAIISLTKNGKIEILKWKTGIVDSKISVIPCCADLNHFSENSIDTKLAAKLGSEIKGKPILTYIGSVGTWYMLNEMLDFFKILLSKYSGAKFLFLTPDKPDPIYNLCKEKNIPEDSVVVQFSTREQLPTYMSISHYAIFFIMPTYSKKASSPTKHGEIMSMGIPLICNAGVGDVDDIVTSTKSGIIVHDFSPESYLKAIHQLETTTFNSSDIRMAAQDIYSLKDGVKKYNEVYQQMLSKK